MSIIRTIMPGDMMPPWYGLVRHRCVCRDSIVAPIPLNVVLRAAHEVHYWFVRGCLRARSQERDANLELASYTRAERKFLDKLYWAEDRIRLLESTIRVMQEDVK